MLVSNINTDDAEADSNAMQTCANQTSDFTNKSNKKRKIGNIKHQILTGCQDDVITLLAVIIANEKDAK